MSKALFYIGVGMFVAKMARTARIKALSANIDRQWKWVNRG